MFLTPSDRKVLDTWRQAEKHHLLACILLFGGAVLGIGGGTITLVAGMKCQSIGPAGGCLDDGLALALYAISGNSWLVFLHCFVSMAHLRLDSRRYAVVQKLLAALSEEREPDSGATPRIE